MLEELSSGQITEWMAFYQLEPWGYETEMMGHGITASRIDNLFRKEDELEPQPSDYIPKLAWPGADQEETNIDDEDPFIIDLKEYFRRT